MVYCIKLLPLLNELNSLFRRSKVWALCNGSSRLHPRIIHHHIKQFSIKKLAALAASKPATFGAKTTTHPMSPGHEAQRKQRINFHLLTSFSPRTKKLTKETTDRHPRESRNVVPMQGALEVLLDFTDLADRPGVDDDRCCR
jgi:hypothetical protein